METCEQGAMSSAAGVKGSLWLLAGEQAWGARVETRHTPVPPPLGSGSQGPQVGAGSSSGALPALGASHGPGVGADTS